MADPAAKPTPRGADRVRRVNAHRPSPIVVTAVGSATLAPDATRAILEMIAAGREE